MANACGAADREKVTSSLSMAADQPAHWTTKNSADPLWPTTSENTVVTVVQARFQFLYPFCSGPSSSASKMRSLSIFLSTNYFFQWDGLRVCLFDRPPFFYINKPVLGHSNEFPLLMIFFHNKQKTQRPQLHPDCGGGLGQKWYQNWNRRFTTVATMSSDLTGHTGKAEFSEVQCARNTGLTLTYNFFVLN